MSAQRFIALVFVALLGFVVGHYTRAPWRINPVPHWPAEPPSEVIVSHPEGERRRAHHLKVVRVSDSHVQNVMVAGQSRAGPWRVVMSTPAGTFYCLCEHVSEDVGR